MHVLMVTDYYYPWVGGGTTYVHEVGKRLVERGHVIHVLMPRWEKSWKRAETIEGIQVTRHDVMNVPLLRYWTQIVNIRKEFERLIRKWSYDVVVLHQFTSALGVILSARRTKIASRLIWTFHGPPHKEMQIELKSTPLPRVPSLLERIYKDVFVELEVAFAERATRFELRAADHVVVLSNYAKKELMELAPHVPEAQIALIPGGVDLERFRPHNGEGKHLRNQLGLPDGKFIIFTLRRLVPRMGLENLIRSLPLILSEWGDVMLVVGGSGFLQGQLKSVAAALDLQEHVKFTGFIPDETLPLYYQAADLFVLPTVDLEGFGFPILEALACGIPALVTPVGASPEIMERFDPLMVMTGARPQDMARSVIEYISASRERLHLSKECRDFAVRHYGWNRIVDNLEGLYLELSGQVAVA